jgi:alkaline phosphatase
MASKVDLLVAGGGEYFFGARLTGHDTSYSRDGDNVNPREDYTYVDADNAVDQPTWRPVLAVGLSYRLGAR